MSLVDRATLMNRKRIKVNQLRVTLRKSDKVAKTGYFYTNFTLFACQNVIGLRNTVWPTAR